VALTKERKGEIALQILKHLLVQKGIRINGNTKREIINEAKQAGLPENEVLELAEELIRDRTEEVLKSFRKRD
jgi:DNA-binding transcriptional regulator YhcF (GntR family)